MRKKLVRLLVWLCFIGYTSCLLYWMFLGFGRRSLLAFDHFDYDYNVVPFRTIGMYIWNSDSLPIRTRVINLLGNIVVFMPFGVLLPLLFGKARRYRAFLLVFCCPLVVLEVLQMLLRVGSMDVDDVILNTMGASLAYGLYVVFERRYGSDRIEMKYRV
ncbi:VanZ family protein [Paenibacillus sp. LMG 31457]|uniref:VanZ family protein n=2 Tax=Paenibacillus planticolens TaxID=2654976 RepID=A0ABX1ZV84_9BACL|nr:VanZ family protein [Paenibacillus planticolens]